MTDPTGRSFLSYSRARLYEANLLITFQREIGIPTWQDVEDLETEQTESQIKKELTSPTTANAVLYLTPEVEKSTYIQEIEAPYIFRRLQAEDDFFLVPVAAGGLSYKDAASLVRNRTGLHDLSAWNLLRVPNEPDPAHARQVADRVLRQRLDRIHRRLPSEEPLHVSLMARAKPPVQSGKALVLDWSHYFRSGRIADPAVWETSLLPALRQVKEAIHQQVPDRALVVSGLPTLSAAAAFGCTFLNLTQIPVVWRQQARGQPDQLFSHDVPAEATAFWSSTVPGSVDADDVAVLLSVTKDAVPAFRSSPDLPPMRAIVDVRVPGPDFTSFRFTHPGQAVDVATKTVEAMFKARDEYRPRRLHLFMAVPAGLALLVGQLLNTLGPVQIYEHDEVDAVGCYRPGVLLRAAS